MLQVFSSVQEQDMPADAHGFSKKYLPYGEVDLTTDVDSMVTYLLSGLSCLLIDGYDRVILIDCRTYPARGVSEPEKDKVLRGSRDGFVETLIFNTALVRRRIRDVNLTVEIMQTGESSHTDIAICYMKRRVDENLLKKIKDRIRKSPCGRPDHEPGEPGGVYLPPQMVQPVPEIPLFRAAGHGGGIDPRRKHRDPGGQLTSLHDPAVLSLRYYRGGR